ncbi:uncharacterized protein LOC119583066 [Penaeus monodon]|uniref:uncharacterized protein LOC119583066 n=1 Tax=Penaeus monodon TaxID=6687 RepID=UPI0018A7A394|nr:uncharacterized protein LOC119583066 [Penaeus monodon]
MEAIVAIDFQTTRLLRSLDAATSSQTVAGGEAPSSVGFPKTLFVAESFVIPRPKGEDVPPRGTADSACARAPGRCLGLPALGSSRRQRAQCRPQTQSHHSLSGQRASVGRPGPWACSLPMCLEDYNRGPFVRPDTSLKPQASSLKPQASSLKPHLRH